MFGAPRRVGRPRFVTGFPQGAQRLIAGWSSPVARQAHNLKVIGSNPIPATKLMKTPVIPMDCWGFVWRPDRLSQHQLTGSNHAADHRRMRGLGGITQSRCFTAFEWRGALMRPSTGSPPPVVIFSRHHCERAAIINGSSYGDHTAAARCRRRGGWPGRPNLSQARQRSKMDRRGPPPRQLGRRQYFFTIEPNAIHSATEISPNAPSSRKVA
jgi:hypothetical protein